MFPSRIAIFAPGGSDATSLHLRSFGDTILCESCWAQAGPTDRQAPSSRQDAARSVALMSFSLVQWRQMILHRELPNFAAHVCAHLARGAVMHAVVDARIDDFGDVIRQLVEGAGHAGRAAA